MKKKDRKKENNSNQQLEQYKTNSEIVDLNPTLSAITINKDGMISLIKR